VDRVHQDGIREPAVGKPCAIGLHVDAMPEEDQSRQQRQREDPQPALGKEDTAQFDPGDRPRLTRARGE
jgi:hypothetical protein